MELATLSELGGDLFTFQSGSILIKSDLSKVREISAFTFQSGSILMQSYTIALVYSLFIYIPIWFYSNQEAIATGENVTDLHSNLVLF